MDNDEKTYGTATARGNARGWLYAEHDAEKCKRLSDDIVLSLFNLEQDSDFRSTRPKIILF
ncbi:hypothetical protein ELH43_19030 [Rhizobium ruizarguesonis]|nr:hypothetical protein ELI48_19290 [Rhizobium ruizarguesonis]TAU49971.1 hypothetical protein ELI42_18960 [Rhizobium ruizarguesonis]TAU65042.1 hypothetical protein ELI44_18980 [Rhizobium ruizarguesonis]TAU69947.1 hypothetical protein ELI45_20035 [Rhizobium ruizarguesonis]TAV07306.1 hypothetical protein ELI39_19465 [Rhizobium ruizarguesonis]